jgi:DNA polymerase I
MRITFERLPGDRAAYSFRDGAGAMQLARISPFIAVDIETGSADSHRRWNITAVSIGTADRAHVLDPIDDRDAIRDCISSARELVFHGGAYDVPIMVSAGLMSVSDIDKVTDTLITARMAAPGEMVPKKLGAACQRHLGGDYARLKDSLERGFKTITGAMSKSVMFDRLGLDSPAFVAYSAFDVVMTARLHTALPAAVIDRLNDAGPFPGQGAEAAYLIEREQTVNRMLLKRSARGIAIDFGAIDRVKADLRNKSAVAAKEISTYGLDPDAQFIKQDVVDWLFDKGELPDKWPRGSKGKLTTDKRWLAKIGHPLADHLGEMTQADRFEKDYLDKILDLSRHGRIHPQVKVMVATTGRMSYGNPPIQQMPGKVREMFRADEPITSFDWSSIEPVLFANFAKDESLLSEFESGGDIYMPVARAAGVDRKTAKTVLLALLYGRGIPNLAVQLNVTVDEARALTDKVFSRMPAVKSFIDKVRNVGNSYGVVPTMSGRIIPLEKDPRYGGYTGYKGVNYVIQGSGLDMLSEALFAMHRAGLDDALYFALHDELVVATSAAPEVERIMLTPPPALIALAGRTPKLRISRSDLGHNWMEKA